ncbi:hypothetical protein FA15DRAFT_668387 [Coprinopsis marcescibilis]|uniref:Uncharacterized protein n=1 Tax=Coprinopsis marcescibilis TaxID=230819 RepID=A0A5C3KYL5_COPMA|nr:hypothetical protein FA15DRAFT_668387 [Coprinopsis marcescibilis]
MSCRCDKKSSPPTVLPATPFDLLWRLFSFTIITCESTQCIKLPASDSPRRTTPSHITPTLLRLIYPSFAPFSNCRYVHCSLCCCISSRFCCNNAIANAQSVLACACVGCGFDGENQNSAGEISVAVPRETYSNDSLTQVCVDGCLETQVPSTSNFS